MKARQLWFTGPRSVEVHEQELTALRPGEVLVQSLFSAVSAGSEMLVYRGQLPGDMALDASLESLQHNSPDYPLRYGYASVGRVEETGADVDPDWLGKTVFAFQPHASHFICGPSQLVSLPDDIDLLAAVFLANMETAVTLLLDGRPRLGEQVVVLGLGIIGQLVTKLLADFPLTGLFTVDRIGKRRLLSKENGAYRSFHPEREADYRSLKTVLQEGETGTGADLVYELTGAPEALNTALSLCGFSSRVVVGSWYGSKATPVELGRQFHRNRISITGSQVSSIAPELTGRWDKTRQFALAWDMIRRHRPEQLITHRVPFNSAPEAYKLLDEQPEEVLQTVFQYSS